MSHHQPRIPTKIAFACLVAPFQTPGGSAFGKKLRMRATTSVLLHVHTKEDGQARKDDSCKHNFHPPCPHHPSVALCHRPSRISAASSVPPFLALDLLGVGPKGGHCGSAIRPVLCATRRRPWHSQPSGVAVRVGKPTDTCAPQHEAGWNAAT